MSLEIAMLRLLFMVWILGLTVAMGIVMVKASPAANQANGCENPSTTAAMRACENTRYETADRQLNQIYGRLMRDLDKNRQEKLRVAQRAWLQFRDANAEFLASAADGGTLAPLLKITALADMTEARTKELRKIAER
jgi:uncharacterized protein YecT (DUF1311 family)